MGFFFSHFLFAVTFINWRKRDKEGRATVSFLTIPEDNRSPCSPIRWVFLGRFVDVFMWGLQFPHYLKVVEPDERAVDERLPSRLFATDQYPSKRHNCISSLVSSFGK
ncbi:hypothetical protein HA466_0018740 [Hirschfeldia incana]|nr:hypothetical protein HA466_0018740 [Hirschfeldia incana]